MQKTISIIDLCALKNNALIAKKLAGDRIFYAVVKADAYGHGAVEIARELESIVDGFCVAIISEGVELRVGGITKPIVVFTPPLGIDDVCTAEFYNLEVTVNNLTTAKIVKNIPCHIKVNSGMNRYGCSIRQVYDILDVLSKEQIKGVYTHLYAADNLVESKKQVAYFSKAQLIVKEKNDKAIAHLASSGGILLGQQYLSDGVRCGIMLYGYAPHGFSNRKQSANGVETGNLTPILKVYARMAQSTTPYGGGVGYALSTKDYKKLHTYRLGYADGFARNLPLGECNLCMDCFISQNGATCCFSGYLKDLIGENQLTCVMDNAEEVAHKLNTISYEVLCQATKRSQRIYIK